MPLTTSTHRQRQRHKRTLVKKIVLVGSEKTLKLLQESVEVATCEVATVDEVKKHGYKLTPGIYVGTQVDDEDDVPFEEKMPELVDQLRGQFAEAERLQAKIMTNLEGLLP